MRTLVRAGNYQAASQQLRARSADGFVDSVGVNANIGPANPDYTATWNNDITVWAAKMQDVGIRKVRIANWLRPGDDQTLAKLARFGVTPQYILWDQATYTELATGKYPVPWAVESYNEGYAFNSVLTAVGSGAPMPMFGTYRGNWANATAYNVGDVVTVSGANNTYTYYCKLSHTSNSDGPTINVANYESARWVSGWMNDVRLIATQRIPTLRSLPGWGSVLFAAPSLYISQPYQGNVGRVLGYDIGNLHEYGMIPGGRVEAVMWDPNFPFTDAITGNSLQLVTEIGGWRAGPPSGVPNGLYEIDEFSAATLALRALVAGYYHKGGPYVTYLWEFCESPHSYQEGGPTDKQQCAGLCYATVNTNPGGVSTGAYKQALIQLKRLIALLTDTTKRGDGALLGVQVSGSTSNVVTQLFAKGNGRFYLGVYVNVDVCSTPGASETNTSFTISAATAASPIQVTATGHVRTEGETVVVTGGTGLAGINGTWTVHVVDANNLTLIGSTGTGTYNANSASLLCYSMGKPVNTSQAVTVTFDRSFSAINVNNFRAGTVTPLTPGNSAAVTATQDIQILELVP